MLRDLFQEMLHIIKRLQMIGFCSFHNTVNDCRSFGSIDCINHLPVLLPNTKASDCPFGCIIVNRDISICKKDMGHLLSLPQGSASLLPATVRKKESRIVPVAVSFPSLTAILDGILPETAFISATTYICLSPPTRKATFLFFLC